MISVSKVDFAYPKKPSIFSQLDLELKAGKIYGLLGKNGMGKSTLMRLLAGLHHPVSGSIDHDDISVGQRKVSSIKDIFFLSEETFVSSLSVYQYINTYKKLYTELDEESFYKNLAYLEIDESSILTQLSLGQKKKFLLSFGLSCGAKYLFLDEPTSHLDIPSKQKFRKLVADNFSPLQTIIISTHHIEEISSLLDNIIILDKGVISLDVAITEIEKKLACISNSNEDYEMAIHTEFQLGKYLHLIENTENIDSEIPLSLLFNAVTENPQVISSIFKN